MKRAFVFLVLAVFTSGCFRGGGAFFAGALTGAIVTSAIISASAPPPPRVVYVPAPREGYVWQPGYWTMHDGEWEWVHSHWIATRAGYVWYPTHWEQQPDGNYRLVEGQWVLQGEPPPPEE
jgi:hypothetical protein